VRFERVKAHAFGRLVDAELRFAPGLTLVHGPNEAGKSTWHDALYVGLCGRRRVRGGRTKEESRFEESRRPWSRDDWQVAVEIALADGRRIGLRHDLDGMVDCSATDLVLGRDVSAEIMNDGSPDGAKFLGLDRRSFLATACVRQADVLGVLEDPDRLQEHLQRAAASAGRDETAGAALDHIDAFLRDHVGVNRAGATRPLRRALEGVEAAEQTLDRATADHESFLRLAAEADDAAVAAEVASRRLLAVRAALAAGEARDERARLERVRSLAKRFPKGRPQAPLDDDTLAQRVSAALSAWRQRPELHRPNGLSAEELRLEIAGLPDAPDGDCDVHESVNRAAQELHEARTAVELHQATKPEAPAADAVAGLDVDELRELAHALAQAEPVADPRLEDRVEQARRRVRSLETRRRAAMGVGALLALAGGAGVLWGPVIAGAALCACGLAVLAWSGLRRDDGLQPGARSELREIEVALAAEHHLARVACQHRDRARERAESLGFPADPVALRERADEAVAGAVAARRLDEWETRHGELCGRHTRAANGVVAALGARGVDVHGPAEAELGDYRRECQRRRSLAGAAARRPGLENQLAAREASEASLASAERTIDSARRGLRECAELCRVADDTDETRVVGLSRWIQARREALGAHGAAVSEYAELDQLLGGGTLAEFERAIERAERRAEQLCDELGTPETDVMLEDDPSAQLAQLEREEREASREAQRLRGRTDVRTTLLRGVPEAEEALEAARAELDRIETLSRTLERTRGYLESAQERVYRSIAPVLADTLRAWLPRVTGSRYQDVSLDPATLEVQVCEATGAWRPASRLSHGTAEQIYLLLRMALASHLTAPGESCPLVLDEATVQADTARTEAVLDLLHAVSRERQVILFSQEAEVLAWAEARLVAPDDAVVHLAGPDTPDDTPSLR